LLCITTHMQGYIPQWIKFNFSTLASKTQYILVM
jgi:hypothetical protein